MFKLQDSITGETIMTLTESQKSVLNAIREANARMINYQDRADEYRQAEFDETMASSYERWSEEMYSLEKGMLYAFNTLCESNLNLPSALFDKIVTA